MKKLKLVTAILLIALASCKKEEKIKNGGVSELLPSMMGAGGPPSNNGVYLEFNNLQHFYDWQDYLDEEVENPLNTDVDSLLAVVESSELNNFYSLRQEIIVRNGLDDPSAEFYSEEIDNMFACDFVIDDVLKSCLNKNHEVKIGDSVYIYFAENIILAVHYTNEINLNELRDVEKCEDEIDFELLNPSITISQSSTTRNVGGPDGACTHLIIVEEGSDSVKYKYHYYPYWSVHKLPCNLYDRSFSYQVYYDKYLDTSETQSGFDSLVSTYNPVTVNSASINFGDGNSSVLSSSTGQKLIASHTYSSFNTFYAKVTSNFTDALGNTHVFNGDVCDAETVTIDNNTCAPFYAHQQGSEELNGWKMSYNIYIGGTGRNYLGCWTRAWKEVRPGRWRHRRTMMQAYTKGIFRDGFCVESYFPESINKNRCRRKMTAKSKRYKITSGYASFKNGDSFSVHALTNRGISYTNVLNLCN